METVSPLIRGIAMLPIIAMVVLMAAGALILVSTGLYIVSDTVAGKVDDARFRFRVWRIKRQMEDEV